MRYINLRYLGYLLTCLETFSGCFCLEIRGIVVIADVKKTEIVHHHFIAPSFTVYISFRSTTKATISAYYEPGVYVCSLFY